MSIQTKRLGWMKKIIYFLRNLWLMVGLTLMMLFLLEAALDLFYGLRQPARPAVDSRANADGYENATWTEDYFAEFAQSSKARWKSYTYWRRLPYSGQYITINQDGIRLTTFPAVSTADQSPPLRIFMFGGSTLWGTGARDNYTIPSLLGALLTEKGIKVEITNFGESGYVSTQETVALLLQLQKGNVPDIVIFYDGVNDTFSAFQQGLAGLPQNEDNRRKEFNLLNRSRYGDLINVFLLATLEKTSLYRAAKAIMRRVEPNDEFLPNAGVSGSKADTIALAVTNHYLANVKIVDSLGKTYGFRPIFYWQPVIYTKDTLTPYEAQELEARRDAEAFYKATYQVMKDRHSDFSAYSFYNLSDIFAETDEPVFIDFSHLTEAGNQIIADRMVNDLLALLD